MVVGNVAKLSKASMQALVVRLYSKGNAQEKILKDPAVRRVIKEAIKSFKSQKRDFTVKWDDLKRFDSLMKDVPAQEPNPKTLLGKIQNKIQNFWASKLTHQVRKLEPYVLVEKLRDEFHHHQYLDKLEKDAVTQNEKIALTLTHPKLLSEKSNSEKIIKNLLDKLSKSEVSAILMQLQNQRANLKKTKAKIKRARNQETIKDLKYEIKERESIIKSLNKDLKVVRHKFRLPNIRALFTTKKSRARAIGVRHIGITPKFNRRTGRKAKRRTRSSRI